MCLGVPGQVVEWLDHDPIFARAVVEFSGLRRECQMACVPEAQVGDYVVVHAGIAVSRIDAAAAEDALREWDSMSVQESQPDDWGASPA